MEKAHYMGTLLTQSRQSAKLFLQSPELALPQPLTRRRVCPPPRGHTRWRERGHTLWYSLYIRTVCLLIIVNFPKIFQDTFILENKLLVFQYFSSFNAHLLPHLASSASFGSEKVRTLHLLVHLTSWFFCLKLDHEPWENPFPHTGAKKLRLGRAAPD